MAKAEAVHRGLRIPSQAHPNDGIGFIRLAFGMGMLLTALLMLLITAVQLLGHAFDQGQIAFESDRTGVWNLYLLDVGTTAVVPITRATTGAHWPSWSPDGQQLAYNNGSQGMASGELFIMDANGTNARQVTQSGGNHWHPSWSPDGRRLVFMYNFQFMRVINVDGSNERGIGSGFNPGWSPDGSALLFYDDQARRANTDIYMAAPDGSRITSVTTLNANDWTPVWSPDGRWIAFISSRAGRAGADLYLTDAACTRAADVAAACEQAVKRLTFVNGNLGSPTWAPDSHRLAYTAQTADSTALYVVDIETGSTRRLTGTGRAQSPAWRPLKAAD